MSEMQTMSHESSGICWCGPDNHGPEKPTAREVLDEIKQRLDKANPLGAEWEALTDPGDRHTAPSWIVDADDLEIRLDATYAAGKVAVFIASAPKDVARLSAALEAALAACNRVIDNTDGHKPPGPPNPTREQATAVRIWADIQRALGKEP